MRSDFDIITHRFEENNDIIIYPISDVHLGASEHMKREWSNFCNNLLQIPNAYIVLGGDLINNSTRNSVANVFAETMRPREQKKVMAEMLEPIKSRILCAVTGNHERRSSKDADDDPTYDILCKIDREDIYRENIAFVKIQIGDVSGAGLRNPTYILAVTHGAGGGMLTGGSVNRNERFGYVIDGMDCLIVGHTHKPFITQPSKLKIDAHNNKVSLKPFKVVSTTSWLNYGGYAVQKMLIPASHSPQEIVLCGNHKEIKVTM